MEGQKKSVSENKYFISLVQLIKENDITGRMIRKILLMKEEVRIKFIDELTETLKKEKNDENFIEAVSYLKRQDIVDEINKTIIGEI